jgi:hypothetical protein
MIPCFDQRLGRLGPVDQANPHCNPAFGPSRRFRTRWPRSRVRCCRSQTPRRLEPRRSRGE